MVLVVGASSMWMGGVRWESGTLVLVVGASSMWIDGVGRGSGALLAVSVSFFRRAILLARAGCLVSTNVALA